MASPLPPSVPSASAEHNTIAHAIDAHGSTWMIVRTSLSEHPRSGLWSLGIVHPAIHQTHNPVGTLGDAHIVRHHDERLPR